MVQAIVPGQPRVRAGDPVYKWKRARYAFGQASAFLAGSQTSKQGVTLVFRLFSTQARYHIDSNRVYVAGLSMGGYATWDVITRFPKRFAAAIPICGGADTSKAPLIKSMPIWAFHGDSDHTSRWRLRAR